MSLITLEELARGACIAVGGGLAGTLTMTMPGSALWLIPAGAAVAGCALTVPEIRAEAARALPLLAQARRALPAGAWALPGIKPRAEALAQRSASPEPAQRGAAPAAAPAGAMARREWLAAVNDRPDESPHLTVVGPSGSGKTTFVAAALGARPGRVVVLTPKVTPGAWRGAQVVTLGDDLSYDPLAAAIDELQVEARRRSKALAQGQPLEPLTVVLDELPELHAEIPGAGKFAVRLSRWGRELGMRQVVIATSDDALNIPGWAATRSNYVRVELARPTAEGARPAWLDDGQARRPLDLAQVRAGAEQSKLRPWHDAPAQAAPVAAPRASTLRRTPPPVKTHARPVEPMAAGELKPGYLDYPRRDSGSCVNDALAQLLGYDPGLPSWVEGEELPKLAQHYGLGFADSANKAAADAWLHSGEPVALAYQTADGVAHLEYTRTPILLLRQLGWPIVRGVFHNPAQPAQAEPADLLASLLAEDVAAARAAVPSISPERAERLARVLARNGVPAHQNAEGMAVNPVPGNGINAPEGHSSVTVEGGDGTPVTVNVTQVAPQGGRKGSAERTAYTAALEALYEALGEDGTPFAKAYAQHKGTKEIAFTAWQRGRARRA